MAQRSALLIGALTHTRPEWQALSPLTSTLHEYPTGTRADFLALCRANAFPNLYALYRSNDSNKYTGNFDAELLAAGLHGEGDRGVVDAGGGERCDG
ncbi:hypothetical protein GRF29_28g1510789 [Pseudopithomyces chartarum]|uniref:Uncharacterized protein n=1 Tax=Pseudopithomyces chartarum TaxID=1892770 RepID=A0AAN6RHX9_9PLEO|nr:hypothetical protein GRF29_28g1510789 [Pseudopithomyces chartarum]